MIGRTRLNVRFYVQSLLAISSHAQVPLWTLALRFTYLNSIYIFHFPTKAIIYAFVHNLILLSVTLPVLSEEYSLRSSLCAAFLTLQGIAQST